MSASQYGKWYYCVKLRNGEEIRLMADEVEIYSGAVIFLHKKQNRKITVNLCIADGQWDYVYAASCIDGGAIAVEHWSKP